MGSTCVIVYGERLRHCARGAPASLRMGSACVIVHGERLRHCAWIASASLCIGSACVIVHGEYLRHYACEVPASLCIGSACVIVHGKHLAASLCMGSACVVVHMERLRRCAWGAPASFCMGSACLIATQWSSVPRYLAPPPHHQDKVSGATSCCSKRCRWNDILRSKLYKLWNLFHDRKACVLQTGRESQCSQSSQHVALRKAKIHFNYTPKWPLTLINCANCLIVPGCLGQVWYVPTCPNKFTFNC